MKSTTQNTIYFLVSFILFLVFTGYTPKKLTPTIDYLNIQVKYQLKSQQIIISDENGEIEKYMILSPSKKNKKAKFEKKGYTVLFKELPSYLDNSILIDIMEKYAKDGWVLNSQSLGMTNDGQPEIIPVQYDHCIGQYMLIKEK